MLVRVGFCLLLDNLVPRILSIHRQQVCVELEHLLCSGFLLVLDGLCGFFGLPKVLLVVSMQFRVWCVSRSCAFLGLLGSLLGSSFILASGIIQLSQSGLCLLCQFVLLHLERMGFCAGLEGALFLDCIESHAHVHEKGFMHPTMPDGET
jgi:hypothetical protein